MECEELSITYEVSQTTWLNLNLVKSLELNSIYRNYGKQKNKLNNIIRKKSDKFRLWNIPSNDKANPVNKGKKGIGEGYTLNPETQPPNGTHEPCLDPNQNSSVQRHFKAIGEI